jgi:D-xylose transport system permease protein
MSTITPPEKPSAAPEATSSTPGAEKSLIGIANAYITRIRGGDVGSLPAVLGLIVLIAVFSILRPNTFTTSSNVADLIGQAAGICVLAMGLVFVLLLGEIDLGAGYTAGVSAAVVAVLVGAKHNWPLAPAIIVGLLTGAVIGAAVGLIVAKLGIPSFVVTLATFLGLQGVLLKIVGEGKSLGFTTSYLFKLNNSFLPIWLGWVLAIAGVALWAVASLWGDLRRRRKGLGAQPLLQWGLKVLALAVIVFALVGYLSRERSRHPDVVSLKGVPISVLVMLGLLVVLSLMLSKTAWGRHVYAVGGNAEAARRAGISLSLIRTSCFVVSSTVAAIAGILIASRAGSVDGNTGGGTTLLFGVGAAVIGGTSLFGGKGRVADALIGGFVVTVISNGLTLLNQPQSNVLIVTGLVLLIAASVDAITRRRASATGRA